VAAESSERRLCQICGRKRLIPDEIRTHGAATCKECALERSRAGARRRYYEKAGVPDGFRLCRWCGLPKQVGVDMTPQGRTCRTCRHDRAIKRARVTRYERIAAMSPAERQVERARMTAKARRQRSTPEARARHNAQQKAWREANPGEAAAAQKRYRKKMMADPETAAQWRDYQRIYHRIWRERKGMVTRELSEEEYRNGNGAGFVGGHLPIGPLADAIADWLGATNGHGLGGNMTERSVTGASYEQLAELTGISSRTLREIATRKRKVVQYATADAVCAGLDTPIASVYQ
jgi:hypothetical protein